MSNRKTPLVALAIVVAGAVVASAGGDEPGRATPAVARPGTHAPALPSPDVLASTWYCAAGTAERGGMADHTVVVYNPGDEPVTGTVTVRGGGLVPRTDDADEDAGGDADDGEGRDRDDGEGRPAGDPWVEGPSAQEEVEVEPGGRAVVRLADVLEAQLAAALVETDGRVVVEHLVTGPDGSDVGPCATSASPESYLAWGATTRDARNLLVLFNPFPTTATVDLRFGTDDGAREPVRFQGLLVPAGGVVGVDVGREVPREGQVSATVRARTGSVVVERLQSYDGSGESGIRGLALTPAVPEPLEAWSFGFGRVVRGWQERVVVANPTGERAEVDVIVRPRGPDEPDPPPFHLSLRPGAHKVLDLGEGDRVSGSHATLVRSSNGVPVVAERVLVFPARGGEPGDLSASTGAALADTRWLFATPGIGRRPISSVLVHNPALDGPATVTVTGVRDGDELTSEDATDVEVPPGRLVQVDLEGDLADAEAIEVHADRPVVAERSAAGAGRVTLAIGPGVLADESPLPIADIDAGLPAP